MFGWIVVASHPRNKSVVVECLVDFPGAVEGAGEITRNADADYCFLAYLNVLGRHSGIILVKHNMNGARSV